MPTIVPPAAETPAGGEGSIGTKTEVPDTAAATTPAASMRLVTKLEILLGDEAANYSKAPDLIDAA